MNEVTIGFHGSAEALRGFADIRAWLIKTIATQLGIDEADVDVNQTFTSFGLSSRQAVMISGELQDWLRKPLPATLLYDRPTIEALAAHLSGSEERAAESSSSDSSARAQPIAIVGLSCRFPGAKDAREFWRLLSEGADAIREVPAARWDVNAVYDQNPAAPGKINTRWGGFLEDIDKFDPLFFGMSPREAVFVDPQQRLLLEVAWETFEDAGIKPSQFSGQSVGVFIGLSNNEYGRVFQQDLTRIEAYSGTGNALSMGANRLSYFFNFQGPSMAIDTACSSSLVAVSLACQSLWSGQSKIALAGGANLILSPAVTVNFTKARAMAEDGRCKAFDSRADGYVRSEGIGLVLLKPLSDALADGDDIYAVIRGAAMNQDGRTNGVMAPSRDAQAAVIRAACRSASVTPGDLQFIETHGTGTILGDAIEAGALGDVLREYRSAEDPVAIGSVKTNIGHLEAAAGVAALIKLALSIKQSVIPSSLHFLQPNPEVNFKALPIRVQTTPGSWDVAKPVLAGVSSFGFGGANAHLILEASPAKPPPREQAAPPVSLLTLSARSPEALSALCVAYAAFLEGCDRPFDEICASAALHRECFDHRLAVAASSAEDCATKLGAHIAGETHPGCAVARAREASTRQLAFVFSGQGSQWAGMVNSLSRLHPVFRLALKRCDAHFQRLEGWSLFEDQRDSVQYIQPTLFAIQFALSELWRHWGVTPDVVIGHSMGEVAGACAAGALTLEEGVRVICARAKLLSRIAGQGAMALIDLPRAEVETLLEPHAGQVSVASVNGPSSTVISGNVDLVNDLVEAASARDIFARLVKVDVASHSSQVEPLCAELATLVGDLAPRATAVRILSTVTGEPIDGEKLSAEYWRRNLREPVLFGPAIEQALDDGATDFLEISPNPIVLMGIRQQLHALRLQAGAYPSLRRDEFGELTVLETLGALHCAGYPVAWERLFPERSGKVKLPFYPFQRDSYWLTESKADVAPEPSSWRRICEAGAEKAERWPFDLKLQSEPARLAALDAVATAAIVSTLRQLHIFESPGEKRNAASLIADFGLVPYYEKLLTRWLRRLARAGYLTQADDQFVSPAPLPEPRLEAAMKAAQQACVGHEVLIAYLERCATDLPNVINGRVRPLDLMFPQGSFEITDSLYRLSPPARYFNGIAAALAGAFAREASSRRTIRVLEIGAGTGGTTASILQALEGKVSEYVFTDVTSFFLNKARLEFHRYDFVKYQLLDIEKNPIEQGLREHSFDLIIAANVLHATRDLRETLAHVRRLAKADGSVLLWEVTEQLPWFDISFGLIEGWQRYSDDLRVDGPLLSPAAWVEALRAQGFEDVESFPAARSPASILTQHVILAGTRRGGSGKARANSYMTEVSQYYDGLSQDAASARGRAAFDETYLTFGPLREREPGFSWLLALYDPAAYAEQNRRAREAQAELRRLAFRHVHFPRVRRALDFGCGYGSDILALGSRNPALRIDGYTISGAQAEIGARKILEAGLGDRLRIYNLDSAAAPFPHQYDLVMGFEVAGHVEDKEGLFQNLADHLKEGGQLVMADFVANTLSSVAVKETGAYTATAEEWSDLLARRRLCIEEVVDLSPEVANFLYDPDFDRNLARIANAHKVDELVVKNLASYQNIGRVLERGLMSYTLFSVRKDSQRSAAQLTADNSERLKRPLSYATALRQLGSRDHDLEAPDPRPGIESLLYGMEWRPLAATAAIERNAAATFVILADKAGVGAALASRVRNRSLACVLVHPGERFASNSADEFTIRPTEAADWDRLLQALPGNPMEILHLWGLDERASEAISSDALSGARKLSVFAGLMLTQALLRAENSQASIWFVTQGAQALPEDALPPAVTQAPLWGLGRVAAIECARQWGGLIDLDPTADPEIAARRICELILQPRGQDNQFAVRADQIFVPRLMRSRDALRAHTPLHCRSDGAYLITGGLGALGLALARRLAKRGARRLILIGRGGLPPRSQWKQVPSDSKLARRTRAIIEIEAMGANVQIVSLDVTDERQFGEFLATYNAECRPRIRGVVHAAGLVEGQTITSLDLESLESVLAPKVSGAWNLHRLFGDKGLDFFVLYSSASSLLGPPGQGNYAAANAFLDSLAHFRRSIGLPATSINWGAWSEVGEAASALVERISERGVGRLDVEPALDAFEQVIGNDLAQSAVLAVDWPAWFQFAPSFHRSALLSPLRDEVARSDPPQRTKLGRVALMAALEPERATIVERYLTSLVSQALRIPPQRLDATLTLSDAGVDSLVAVEVKNQIEIDLSITIPIAKLLKGPTITSLSADVLALVESGEVAAPSEIAAASAKGALATAEADTLSDIGELSDEELEALLSDLPNSVRPRSEHAQNNSPL